MPLNVKTISQISYEILTNLVFCILNSNEMFSTLEAFDKHNYLPFNWRLCTVGWNQLQFAYQKNYPSKEINLCQNTNVQVL